MIIKRIVVLSALLTISVTLKAASTAEDCAAITNDTKRLKCYDTFLKQQKSNKKESAEPVKSEPKAPVTPPQPTPEPELTAEQKFGAEQLEDKQAPKKEETDIISSRAIGLYKAWESGISVTLENGQVWEIIDLRSTYHMIENPKITIEKNIFGGYLLGIEGLNKRFRVERKK